MITGIAGIVLIWVPYISLLGLLSAIGALVLGIMGNGRANAMGGAGKGQAIAGIVLGSVALGIFLILVIVAGAVISQL